MIYYIITMERTLVVVRSAQHCCGDWFIHPLYSYCLLYYTHNNNGIENGNATLSGWAGESVILDWWPWFFPGYNTKVAFDKFIEYVTLCNWYIYKQTILASIFRVKLETCIYYVYSISARISVPNLVGKFNLSLKILHTMMVKRNTWIQII